MFERVICAHVNCTMHTNHTVDVCVCDIIVEDWRTGTRNHALHAFAVFTAWGVLIWFWMKYEEWEVLDSNCGDNNRYKKKITVGGNNQQATTIHHISCHEMLCGGKRHLTTTSSMYGTCKELSILPDVLKCWSWSCNAQQLVNKYDSQQSRNWNSSYIATRTARPSLQQPVYTGSKIPKEISTIFYLCSRQREHFITVQQK